MKMKREHVVPLSGAAVSILKRRWALRSDDDGLIFSTSGSPRNIERPRKAAQRFTHWRFGNVEADYGLGQRLARRRSEATILNRTGSVLVTPGRNRSFLPRELRLQHLNRSEGRRVGKEWGRKGR